MEGLAENEDDAFQSQFQLDFPQGDEDKSIGLDVHGLSEDNSVFLLDEDAATVPIDQYNASVFSLLISGQLKNWTWSGPLPCLHKNHHGSPGFISQRSLSQSMSLCSQTSSQN